MKGLDIAQDFFLNWGKPYLLENFPDLLNRMSIGRFSGSDVLRADDDISKDHNWGPQFSIFLSSDDFEKYGKELSQRMNNDAPATWDGYRVAGAGDNNVLVYSISQWIEDHFGFSAFPRSDSDWKIVVRHFWKGGSVLGVESALYYLRNGALWLDNNAEFANWRRSLEKYPESVWYARLAEECMRIWHYGQYNFVQRIANRDDPLAVTMSLGQFVEGVMRILLLLKSNYSPYWKWLAHEFRKLECASHYAPLLDTLVASQDRLQQVQLVEQICDEIYQEIDSVGLISEQDLQRANKYLLPLLNLQRILLDKVPWMKT